MAEGQEDTTTTTTNNQPVYSTLSPTTLTSQEPALSPNKKDLRESTPSVSHDGTTQLLGGNPELSHDVPDDVLASGYLSIGGNVELSDGYVENIEKSVVLGSECEFNHVFACGFEKFCEKVEYSSVNGEKCEENDVLVSKDGTFACGSEKVCEGFDCSSVNVENCEESGVLGSKGDLNHVSDGVFACGSVKVSDKLDDVDGNVEKNDENDGLGGKGELNHVSDGVFSCGSVNVSEKFEVIDGNVEKNDESVVLGRKSELAHVSDAVFVCGSERVDESLGNDHESVERNEESEVLGRKGLIHVSVDGLGSGSENVSEILGRINGNLEKIDGKFEKSEVLGLKNDVAVDSDVVGGKWELGEASDEILEEKMDAVESLEKLSVEVVSEKRTVSFEGSTGKVGSVDWECGSENEHTGVSWMDCSEKQSVEGSGVEFAPEKKGNIVEGGKYWEIKQMGGSCKKSGEASGEVKEENKNSNGLLQDMVRSHCEKSNGSSDALTNALKLAVIDDTCLIEFVDFGEKMNIKKDGSGKGNSNCRKRKVAYSRKQMEKMRHKNVKVQKKFWQEVYYGLSETVRREYDELGIFKHQKRGNQQHGVVMARKGHGVLGESSSDTVSCDAETFTPTDITGDGQNCEAICNASAEEWIEYEESDDEYDTILRPAFAVEGEPDFDSGPPEDGLEYLRRVRWEAAQIPKVRVAKIDKSKLNKEQSVYMPKIPEVEKCPPHLVPLRQWEDEFLADFAKLRLAISHLEDTDDTGLVNPQTVIFGPGKSKSHKPKNLALLEIPSGGPTLSTVLAMDPVTRVSMLKKRINTFDSATKFSKEDCTWLFALCAAVDTPLDADTSASLRCLLRKCAKLRSAKTELDDDAVMLNVLATISGKFFGQLETAL